MCNQAVLGVWGGVRWNGWHMCSTVLTHQLHGDKMWVSHKVAGTASAPQVCVCVCVCVTV